MRKEITDVELPLISPNFFPILPTQELNWCAVGAAAMPMVAKPGIEDIGARAGGDFGTDLVVPVDGPIILGFDALSRLDADNKSVSFEILIGHASKPASDFPTLRTGLPFKFPRLFLSFIRFRSKSGLGLIVGVAPVSRTINT